MKPILKSVVHSSDAGRSNGPLPRLVKPAVAETLCLPYLPYLPCQPCLPYLAFPLALRPSF
jgi:hypothetical protein